jgi:lactate racemase
MRTVQFAFGKSGIPVSLPDGFSYMMVENRSAQPLSDIQAGLDQALDYPIAGPSLLELAAGKKTAAISVCDIARPVPNSTTLPPLLNRLNKEFLLRALVF